jgi:hypothetical protein
MQPSRTDPEDEAREEAVTRNRAEALAELHDIVWVSFERKIRKILANELPPIISAAVKIEVRKMLRGNNA